MLQHCTWPRLAILLAGAIVLYATSLWTPIRQFLASFNIPPAARQVQAPAAAAQAAAEPGAQQQAAQAADPNADGYAQAAAGAAQGATAGAAGGRVGVVQRGGVVWEILTLFVGFITSLLPAWNYNPEDAAVFAAAQEMAAREAREQQQQQQQQGQGQDGAQEPRQEQ